MEKLTVRFAYSQMFRRSARCKNSMEHEAFATTVVEIDEVCDENFPLAVVCTTTHKERTVTTEYRYRKGCFWRKKGNLSTNYHRYDSVGQTSEDDYRKAEENGTLVLDGNNMGERCKLVTELFSTRYVKFGKDYWEVCAEPVGYNYYVSMGVVTADTGWGRESIYNINDVDWSKEKDTDVKIFMPEVFTYGRDEAKNTEAVKEIFDSLWQPRYRHEPFAPKFAEKIFPKVVETVKKNSELPYQFSEGDVYRAMNEVLDGLLD